MLLFEAKLVTAIWFGAYLLLSLRDRLSGYADDGRARTLFPITETDFEEDEDDDAEDDPKGTFTETIL